MDFDWDAKLASETEALGPAMAGVDDLRSSLVVHRARTMERLEAIDRGLIAADEAGRTFGARFSAPGWRTEELKRITARLKTVVESLA